MPARGRGAAFAASAADAGATRARRRAPSRAPGARSRSTTRWLRGRIVDRLRTRRRRRLGRRRRPDRRATTRSPSRAALASACERDGLVELDAADPGRARLASPDRRRPALSAALRFDRDADRPGTRLASRATARAPLPADDPELFELDLRGLRRHWAATAARPPMTAAAMTGADRRAQALGVPGERLMEHAGAAVAAAAQALADDTDRWGHGPIVILCGPGNNGGDGLVAARRLAAHGRRG